MNAHKRALDLEKLKLAQQRLALDSRKRDHREKPDDDVWTDEKQRQASENIEAIYAFGRAYLAREREKERAKTQSSVTSSPSP